MLLMYRIKENSLVLTRTITMNVSVLA